MVQEFRLLCAKIRTESKQWSYFCIRVFADKAWEKLALLVINTCIKQERFMKVMWWDQWREVFPSPVNDRRAAFSLNKLHLRIERMNHSNLHPLFLQLGARQSISAISLHSFWMLSKRDGSPAKSWWTSGHSGLEWSCMVSSPSQ